MIKFINLINVVILTGECLSGLKRECCYQNKLRLLRRGDLHTSRAFSSFQTHAGEGRIEPQDGYWGVQQMHLQIRFSFFHLSDKEKQFSFSV